MYFYYWQLDRLICFFQKIRLTSYLSEFTMDMEDIESSEEEHALFVSVPDLAEIMDSEEEVEID